MAQVRITAEKAGVALTATFNDSETARQILDALPLEGAANVWGDEIYFEIPVTTGEENPQADAPSGTVAYWPPGSALCIFFGQTPYSPVNVVGEIDGDETLLSKVGSGDTVAVERA
ncbi:MAG: cyclophilin-like fold protein [Planctomycetota bacterium]